MALGSFGYTTALGPIETCAYAQGYALRHRQRAQRMDVYLAQTDGKPVPAMIFYHGELWRGGSKNAVPAWLIDGVADKLWSVVAVE